jgi:hypothetical protein
MCRALPRDVHRNLAVDVVLQSGVFRGKRAVVLDALARPEVLRDLERLQYASERFLALDTQSGERGLVAGADPEDGPPVAHLVEGGHL